ncbi:hypothetical protein V2J09_023302 [Rumex salicifolius]
MEANRRPPETWIFGRRVSSFIRAVSLTVDLQRSYAKMRHEKVTLEGEKTTLVGRLAAAELESERTEVERLKLGVVKAKEKEVGGIPRSEREAPLEMMDGARNAKMDAWFSIKGLLLLIPIAAKMTQKGGLFKGKKKKDIPLNRHGKVPQIRKGKRNVKPSKITSDMDANREVSKFINQANEAKAANKACKDGGQLLILKSTKDDDKPTLKK